MDADRDNAHERASAQATDWLILLQDHPNDPGLLRQFRAWSAASPLNATAWAKTDHIAGMITRMPPSFADHWQPLLEAHRSRKSGISSFLSGRRKVRIWLAKPKRVGRLGLAFAAAAITACLAVLVVPNAMLRLRADYVTGHGEIRTIELTDGSSVVLAPDSAIRVSYNDGKRRVELLSGEAFFEVVHDAGRPFQVGVEGIEATDLGTAFDVYREGDGTSIAVQHGRVRVDYCTVSPPVSETLEAYQALRVTWAGTVVRSEEPAGQIAAWREHQLIARDQPMREVVNRLRPYFSGIIIIGNSALENQPVTGVYNLTDPVEALRGIAQALDASVLQISPWILVVSGG